MAGKQTVNETYIDRIKRLKNEKKITNDQLAEMTGIPLSTLSKILAGISDSPKLINVIAIAEALGCSIDYLVNGDHEGSNRYILAPAEARMVEDFRSLDSYGQELTLLIISKEKERIRGRAVEGVLGRSSRILPSPVLPSAEDDTAPMIKGGKRILRMYDMPVSAGRGIDLTDEFVSEIQIPDNEQTRDADYALRVSGNSMEPKFHDGDILLIHRADAVQIGELGIFVLDGAGYFKKYDGDRLLSLNPSYAPIALTEHEDFRCMGRVIGKMVKR